ncbi:MAG: hypothetical protein CSA89_00980 [Bacteroidales bacterium]|nr:MAG: hypothetical protein CSA89_00980 [Bacteroidales bacterium]
MKCSMKKLNKYIILLVVVLLSSCYTRHTTSLLQERKSLPQYDNAQYENYRLQVNDELLLRVISSKEEVVQIFPSSQSVGMGNANNMLAYRIYEDGTVDFPYLKKVPLEGKTIKEAESIVRDRLVDFADDIEVKLALKTQSFCVIGEAGRGYFPIYKEKMTIYQALALSGGIHDGAVFNKIRIIRTKKNETIIKSFDIRTKSIIDSEFYYIQPNDIICVDVSKKKFWASGNWAGFTGLISSSVTFFISVFSFGDNFK